MTKIDDHIVYSAEKLNSSPQTCHQFKIETDRFLKKFSRALHDFQKSFPYARTSTITHLQLKKTLNSNKNTE